MSYRVSILWFNNRDPDSENDYHWSVFVNPVNSTRGTKYDAFASTDDDGTMRWSYSHAPNYDERQSALFGGSIKLGNISDVDSFLELMLSTELPGSDENCQTWVTNVVTEAVRKRMLPKSANKLVNDVPVRA